MKKISYKLSGQNSKNHNAPNHPANHNLGSQNKKPHHTESIEPLDCGTSQPQLTRILGNEFQL